MEINRKRRKILQDASQKLRQLRDELGYSPKEMAARLGVQTVTYYRNESGDSLPNLVSLRKMQKEFGISMDWLLFGSGPKLLEEKTKKKEPVEPEPPQEPAVEEKQPGWEELMPDAKELMEHMAEDPLLRHKVLLFFYEYKNQKELAAAVGSAGDYQADQAAAVVTQDQGHQRTQGGQRQGDKEPAGLQE